ncbi:hypothetical protein ABPG75_002221 [Micractinium tetrahymenae]
MSGSLRDLFRQLRDDQLQLLLRAPLPLPPPEGSDDSEDDELVEPRTGPCLVHRLAEQGDVALLTAMLKADPSLASLPAGCSGMQPLHCAARAFQLPAVEALLAAGVPAAAVDARKRSAVHHMVLACYGPLSVLQQWQLMPCLHAWQLAGSICWAAETSTA